MAPKKILTTNLVCAAALAAPLLLGACADQGPWPLPSGYAYYHDKYKAPPGPEPVRQSETPHTVGAATGAPAMPAAPVDSVTATDLSSGATTTMGTPSTDSMDRGALPATAVGSTADELVGRLFSEFGKPSEPVWIQPASGTAAMPDFENALHAALESHGAHVTNIAGGGPFAVRYAISPASGGQSTVTLTLMSSGQQAAKASGAYNIDGGGVTTSTTTTSSSTTVTSAPMPMTPPPSAAEPPVVAPPPAAPPVVEAPAAPPAPTLPPPETSSLPPSDTSTLPPPMSPPMPPSGPAQAMPSSPAAINAPPTDYSASPMPPGTISHDPDRDPVYSRGAGSAPPPPNY